MLQSLETKQCMFHTVAISRELEKKQIWLSGAVLGFHALTGCDFNSAFYRKGKCTPFSYLEKDSNHVAALRSLSSDVPDKPAITAYVCRLYGYKALHNINAARYQSYTKTTNGKHDNVQVKKINCSSKLPTCEEVLAQHTALAHTLLSLQRMHTR